MVFPHYCFTGGVKFPQGEGSAVIHRLKNPPALQGCHLSVFSECCFLVLLARPSSIRTVLSGFVVLFQHFVWLCSSQSGFPRAPFQFECFILGLFLWPSLAQLLLLLSGFAPFSISPFIWYASYWVFSYIFYPTSQLFFLWFWSF